MADDHNNTTSPTNSNSAVLINSPTSMISNTSSSISVPSSQSAHNLVSSMNNNNQNSNNNMTGGGGPLIRTNSIQNGSILVAHSQSAHQLGHVNMNMNMNMNMQPTPVTPLAAHHQALQQQLQKHFANNNMGKWNTHFKLFIGFTKCVVYLPTLLNISLKNDELCKIS